MPLSEQELEQTIDRLVKGIRKLGLKAYRPDELTTPELEESIRGEG